MPRDSNGLTPKQALFVAEYRKDLNATQAAIRAGYSAKTANEQGARLLASASISKVLAEQTQIALDKVNVSANRALAEASSLAFSDLSAYYDQNGDIKPMSDWTPGMRAAVQSMETLERDITPGERGPAAKVHRLKLWDKPKNLEMLFKHLGLLVEKVQHSGEVAFTWQK
jgi:phage terminase small subunit